VAAVAVRAPERGAVAVKARCSEAVAAVAGAALFEEVAVPARACAAVAAAAASATSFKAAEVAAKP